MKKKLSDKQKAFVKEYLVDLNATQAAVRAGYSAKTANRIGPENLSKPVIQKMIQRRQEELQVAAKISQERVLAEEKGIAFFDPGLLVAENGVLLPIRQLPGHIRRAIAGFTVTERVIVGKSTEKVVERKWGYKFWDKGRSLERVGKHIGMFNDNFEHSLNKETLMLILDALPPAFREAVLRKMEKLI